MRFAGVSHPGLIGTAPSAELLATWTKRETALVDEHPGAVPAVALLPNAVGAYVGQELPEEMRKKIYAEGARTIPGREHGGNCDVGYAFTVPSSRSLGLPSGRALDTVPGAAAVVALNFDRSRSRTCRGGPGAISPSSSRVRTSPWVTFISRKAM